MSSLLVLSSRSRSAIGSREAVKHCPIVVARPPLQYMTVDFFNLILQMHKKKE